MSVFFTEESYTNFDAYVEAAKQWDLDFIQLGPGRFIADLLMFGDDDLQIATVIYNKLLLQRGSAPQKGYTFAVHHHNSAPFLWKFLDFEYGSIIVFPDNKELQGVSQPGHHPITVTISEKYVEEVAHEHGLPEPQRFIPKGKVCICDPGAIYHLQERLISMCSLVKSTAGRGVTFLMTNRLKGQLTRDMLLTLAGSKGIKPKKRQFHRRKILAEQVIDIVNAEPATPKSISELCDIAEVDERTLRNIFYEQFSVSPKKFINFYRLNTVRNALIRIDSSGVNIADIANAFGFWHLGQFARDYHRLFGELPSETIKKHSPDSSIGIS